MATKSGQQEPEKAEVIEELLEALDTTLDRVRVLYEQYFLGIQKQPPAYLHTDIERKIRDLAQLQIRNTALRYRFATLQQKFGSYNSYWRRTLRQIENGTYARNLSKISRQAAQTGAAVPEEILAAMPKRMRDQVLRDREAALALAELRARPAAAGVDDGLLTLADDEVDVDVDDLDPAAFIRESTDLRRSVLTQTGAHRVDESDGEFDVDAFFASVITDDPPAPAGRTALASAPAEPRPSARPRAGAGPAGHPRPQSISGSPVTLPAAAGAGRSPVSQPVSRVAPGAPAASAPRPASPTQATATAGATQAVSSAVPGPAADGPSEPASATAAPAERRRPSLPPPSQATQPLRVRPGAAAARPAEVVETLAGPFPRTPASPAAGAPRVPPAPLGAAGPVSRSSPPAAASDARVPASVPAAVPASVPVPGPARPSEASPVRPSQRPEPPARSATERLPGAERRPAQAPPPRPGPPPGMSDTDVHALYARYVEAKRSLGEEAGPGAYGKLLKTIHAQAPKIMEQYRSSGVDFSVVVKDNQVIIRAKPKP